MLSVCFLNQGLFSVAQCQSVGDISITTVGTTGTNSITGVVVSVTDDLNTLQSGSLTTEATIYPMKSEKVKNNGQSPLDTETIQFSNLDPGTFYLLTITGGTVTNSTGGATINVNTPNPALLMSYVTGTQVHQVA